MRLALSERGFAAMHTREMSRRQALRRGLLVGGAVATTGLLAACGADGGSEGTSDTEASASGAVNLSDYVPPAGSEIPTVNVNFGMPPFADNLIPAVGVEKGWFDEVGIALPLGNRVVTTDQAEQQILNGQLDLAIGYLPKTLQTHAASPGISIPYVGDIFVGNYALAAPNTGAQEYGSFTESGMSFEEAFKASVQQMKGLRVAVSDEGVPRDFFDDLLRIGELTPDDLDLQIVDDSKMVQLAKAGTIDYAFPSGAAQSMEIMGLGYFRVVGIEQMIDGLPPGSPEIARAIGFLGLQARNDYIEENTDTVLRFLSVMFRIMDLLAENPAEVMRVIAPILSASAGTTQSPEELQELFKLYFQTFTFEQAADLLLNEDSTLYYGHVVQSQIDAAQDAGVIPADMEVAPDDLMSYRPLYEILVDLKEQYEELVEQEVPAGGAELAATAKGHYDRHNYLDAYRLQRAALES